MIKKSTFKQAKQRYENLPSYEKENIDRKVDDMVADVERFDASKERSGVHMIEEISKDLTNHAFRTIMGGGYFQQPKTKFDEDCMPCDKCGKVYGSVVRKSGSWYCYYCEDEVPGKIEDEYSNFK